MEFTEKQEKALRRYSGQGYADINETLREGFLENSTLREEIAAIDSAIDEARCDTILIVFRGIGQEYADALKQRRLRKGDVIEDAAYLSTSTKQEIAKRFQAFEPPGLILRITIPKGAPALSLKPLSDYPDEDEWLLPRNTRLRVTGYDRVNRTLEVETM